MNVFEHILLYFSTIVFVFCALACLAPRPVDAANADGKMVGALIASLAAGAIVLLIT